MQEDRVLRFSHGVVNMPTVLLAEDDEQINEILTEVLTSRGYRVTSAFNGTEAIDALGEARFDCAVVDLMMPEADGAEVVSFMEQHRPYLVERTILMSAHPEVAPQKHRARVAAVLRKPFEIETLTDEVARCVEMRPSESRR
jgi:CheY-like chemotaxis protein